MSAWDLFRGANFSRLGDLEAETSRLKAVAQGDGDRLHDLNKRVTQLALISAALWELLKKNTHLSEDDLKREIEKLNASGITPPGAAPPDHVYCPSCDHRISPTANRCLYCGAAVAPHPAAVAAGGTEQTEVAVANHVYCPACRHEISSTVSRCVYCGAAVTPRTASRE